MSDDRHIEGQETHEEPHQPEPPVRYDPNQVIDDDHRQDQTPLIPRNLTPELVSASRFMLAGGIAGPLSMLVGGSLLAAISLVLAIIGYRKAAAASDDADPGSIQLLLRFGRAAIGVCIVALIVNVFVMIFVYPTLIESFSTGDANQLLGGGDTSSGSGNSTWG